MQTVSKIDPKKLLGFKLEAHIAAEQQKSAKTGSKVGKPRAVTAVGAKVGKPVIGAKIGKPTRVMGAKVGKGGGGGGGGGGQPPSSP